MARLVQLSINHFRGIEIFEQWFGNGITGIGGRFFDPFCSKG